MKRKFASIIFLVLFLGLTAALFLDFKKGSFNAILGRFGVTWGANDDKMGLLAVDSGISRAPGPVNGSGNKLSLPLDINTPHVANVYLGYNFFGNIGAIQDTPSGKKLVLEGSGDKLPDFILSGGVQVIKIDANQNQSKASVSDLRVGSQVSISSTYDLKTHEWVTRSVYIIG